MEDKHLKDEENSMLEKTKEETTPPFLSHSNFIVYLDILSLFNTLFFPLILKQLLDNGFRCSKVYLSI